MASSRLDRAAKAVWLVIGLAILLGVVAGVIASAVSYLDYRSGEEKEAPLPATGAANQAGERLPVRYGIPQPVHGSRYRVAELRVPVARRGLSSGASEEPVLSNLLFTGPGEGAGRLLLDRPARIARVDLPDTGQTGRPWIAYRIAFQDTNGDGRLTRSDRSDLYASTLGGDSLRRVLPEGLRPLEHAPFGDGRRILVLALEVPADTTLPEERWRERALVYDPATGTTQPYATLDSLAARAQSLFGATSQR